jgi:environmental stress-induced protein Ves
MFSVLPAAGRPVMPWRNGGGTTAEVARSPGPELAEAFDWRVSLASIERPGAFSAYPGVDRILMPLGPAAVLLDVAGVETLLQPTAQLSFRGDDAVSASLPDGSALVLNVMVRRGGPPGSLTLCSDQSRDRLIPAGSTVVVVAVSDEVLLQGRQQDAAIRLGRLDALRLSEPHHLAVVSGAAVAVALGTARS